MKKFFFLLFLLCFPAINVWAQFEVKLYPTNQPDTLFVLPGEFWAIQHGIYSVNGNNFYAVIAYADLWQYRDKSESFYFCMNGQYNYEKDTMNTFIHTVDDYNGIYWEKLKWMPNYSSAAQQRLWLWVMSGCSKLSAGEEARAYVYGSAWDSVGNMGADAKYQYLIGIDGICGDINRDGVVDNEDVTIGLYGLDRLSMLDWYGRFTSTGVNYGLGRVFFSQLDILSLAMINIWIHNPNDPVVKNLGIGKLMSQRPLLSTTNYTSSLQGKTMTVKTNGFAVNVSTIFPNGKLWSQAAQAVDGQVVMDVPDPTLKYRIEAISLPSSATNVGTELEIPSEFNLSQNYPNPFNPSTVISYSIPKSSFVSLKIYDILGKEVATLVNEEKTEGNYSVNFDGSKLASGTYLCRIVSGAFSQTKKMVLMK